MVGKKILIGLGLITALHTSAWAQVPVRILFIGDSYTDKNDLAYKVRDLANSKGKNVEVVVRAPDAKSFRFHANSERTLDSIRKGNWDYVVLQEQSIRPASEEQLFQDSSYYFADLLDQEIKRYNPNAHTLFYMTWGRNNSKNCGQSSGWSAPCSYTAMDDLISSRYITYAKGLHATVVPVGKVKRYISEKPEIGFKWDVDGFGHPSEFATYAAALTFYTILFNEDPTQVSKRFGLNPDSARNIREAVKEVVYNHSKDWNFPQETALVTETSTGTKITVFPQPFTDVLTIETEERIHSIKLNSLSTGQQLADFNNLSGTSLQLNTSNISLPPGFYTLYVQTDRSVTRIKVEKR